MKCDAPLTVRLKQPIWDHETNNHIYSVPVRCGKCLPCLQYRVNSWIFRIEQEMKVAKSVYFLTVTYTTEHVPLTNKGFMTLRKKDMQDYIKNIYKVRKKRLKDDIPSKEEIKNGLDGTEKIVYYICGEYGSKRRRPHNHIIIMNVSECDVIAAWEDKGEIDVQIPTGGAVKYVLKYIEKKQAKIFKNFDGEMEYSLYSRNIGKQYIKDMKQGDNFFSKNKDVNYLIKDGYKIPMPKYYRKRLLTDEQKRDQIKIIKKEIDLQEQKDMRDHDVQGLDYDRSQYHSKRARKDKLDRTENRSDI